MQMSPRPHVVVLPVVLVALGLYHLLIFTPAWAEAERKQGANPSYTFELPLQTALGEAPVNGEKEAIAEAAKALLVTMKKRFKATKTAFRGDHGKPHACLKGTFTVMQEVLSTDLAVGVAKATVLGAPPSYPVIARLSNAESPEIPDRKSSSRGLALKLLNVNTAPAYLPGSQPNVQDFLMSSAPTFIMRNIVEYTEGFKARAYGGWHFVRFLFKYPGVVLDKQTLFRKAPPSVVTQRYWGKLPYGWGDQAVKYSAWPCQAGAGQQGNKAVRKHEHYQKKFIQAALSQGDICFQFGVQPRPRDKALQEKFPIENGKVRWDETVAPFTPIAILRFPGKDNQDFDSAANRKECEELVFSPWNGLAVHRPLGNLSRARRVVYRASEHFRQARYGATASAHAPDQQ